MDIPILDNSVPAAHAPGGGRRLPPTHEQACVEAAAAALREALAGRRAVRLRGAAARESPKDAP
jgi:hypothetical protein